MSLCIPGKGNNGHSGQSEQNVSCETNINVVMTRRVVVRGSLFISFPANYEHSAH